MNVLVATGLYPPDIGGPATYATMLEAELPKADIQPVVVPFGQVRHLPKLFRHIAYARLLYRKAKHCEVIYALDSVSAGVPALLVSRLRRTPLVVRLGGDYAWEQGRLRFGLTASLDEYTAGECRRPLPVRFFRAIQIFVVSRADRVVLPSEYLKSIVLTWGIKSERIKVIYSALYPLPITESRDVIRKRLSYEGTVLVTAARLTPWKGIDCIIEVVRECTQSGRDMTLVVAGDGEARSKLEQLARDAGVSDRVRFVGKLSKEALGAAIKGADAFVYNTSYEGLPHQLLEVMDLGVPIVTSDIPGNREVITDGVEGVLVAHNDQSGFVRALTRVLDDQALTQRLVDSARVRSQAFAQEKVSRSIIELLHEATT